jgi:hypothetical protein
MGKRQAIRWPERKISKSKLNAGFTVINYISGHRKAFADAHDCQLPWRQAGL